MTVSKRNPQDYPAFGSALAILEIPYVFTQDDLLTTENFLRAAKDRGHRLSLDDLQEFHRHRLLIPLYRVSDISVSGRRVTVPHRPEMNVRGWAFQAASEGRLRDSADEGYSAAWPYRRPADETSDKWWNGFVYSSWQLLNVSAAVNEYEFVKMGWDLPPKVHERTARERGITLALCALATHVLPGILGRLSMPSGLDEAGLRQNRATADVLQLLAIAGFDPADLQDEANTLLLHTQGEPLAKWVPLLRYASYKGWSKLRGEPLDAMWRRVAAEILLRAHEELAADGVVDPLPDLTGSSWHSAQHDRLTPRYEEAQTLERALAELGLSPHPKVILLLEGETELYHVPKLLAEFGVTQPQDVRVQRTKGSKINAHLIARYGVTPRVGRKLDDRWLLNASPTALVIAMDPENHFATKDKRNEELRKLQDAVREEVRFQDADIGQDELDFLVRIRVWGDDSYELANFTDEELVPAITKLARAQDNQDVKDRGWEQRLRAELQSARADHKDIKFVFQRMKMREDKVKLATLLWPTLLSKCELEYASGKVQTPVLNLAVEIREMITRLNGTFAIGVSR